LAPKWIPSQPFHSLNRNKELKTLLRQRFQFGTRASQFGNTSIQADVLKGLSLEFRLQQLDMIRDNSSVRSEHLTITGRYTVNANPKRILFVDDNDDIREVFKEGLENRGFEVVVAANVNDALRHISTEQFDVLLSDLHMPDAGDGFTVVSAMRHANPKAVTLVLSGYPAVQEAMKNILLQADDVLMKPIGMADIVKLIEDKLSNPVARGPVVKQRVAAILERDSEITIAEWLAKVEADPELNILNLRPQARTGHLPLILGDLVRRLRLGRDTQARTSRPARDHGILRRIQGYTISMMVEESRILQVCIFHTLQNRLSSVDFDTVLLDVMTIADEVDSQLKQAVIGFMEAPAIQLAATSS
jgi:CheY-like chemotaxis protein